MLTLRRGVVVVVAVLLVSGVAWAQTATSESADVAAVHCPLNPVRNLTEQDLGDLLGVVPDARIVAIVEACGVELTDDQLSSLLFIFPEQKSVLD